MSELILGEALLRRLAEGWIRTGQTGEGLRTDEWVMEHKAAIQGVYKYCGKQLIAYVDYNARHAEGRRAQRRTGRRIARRRLGGRGRSERQIRME